MFKAEDHSFFAEDKLDTGVDCLVSYLEKTRKNLNLGVDCRLVLGYEAGPTGYGLCRSLQKKRYDCVIMAPSTIKKAPGEKTKTDSKDAQMLAMALSCDAYKTVYLPDPEDEAVKEYTRARNTLAKHLKKAKQNLLPFLLRIGMSYPESGDYWTKKFNGWLDTLDFKGKRLRFASQAYKQEVRGLEGKLALVDEGIESIADEERY
jgi:transposase